MIRLHRTMQPVELTTQEVNSLTKRFVADRNAPVWNKSYIRRELIAFSNNKCSYCETKIDEESKYMEVEHFYCKSKYPGKVVEWHNLLPSCKRCNLQKGDHDVSTEGMIVDPTLDNPNEHIGMTYLSRFKGRTSLGKQTIETVYLNDTDRLVKPRMVVSAKMVEALERVLQDAKSEDFLAKNRTMEIKVTRALEALLLEAQVDKEFSATLSTSITTNSDYKELRNILTEKSLWSASLRSLDDEICRNAFVIEW